MRWALLSDPVPHPGWWNMALDRALLDEAARTGKGYLRLYRWEPWCLSFGCHEPARRRYDRTRIDRLKLDTVRRPTGGRAVWHARELTYAVAAPTGQLGSLRESCTAIHAALAAAVEALGAPTTLAPSIRPSEPGAGACFANPAGGEVLVGGRKLVGSAQLRRARAFLQHGSLLLEDDQSLVAELAGGAPTPLGITLREAVGRGVTFDQAAESIVTAAMSRWGGYWDRATAAMDDLVGRHAALFQDPAWTWRR
jgi:lipoate-protein ligase A